MTIDFKFPSETWCPYPWTHSYQGSKYERKLCCISKDIEGHDKMTTEEFWNSPYMQSVRKKMMAGEQIEVCKGCYRLEKLGVTSLRQESSFGVIEMSLSDPKAAVDKLIGGCSVDNGINKTPPRFFDYRTIHCNLQCVSCGSTYSSQHIKLKQQMWDTEPEFKPDYEYEEGMAREIIDGINNKTVDNIYWAGGEPMMSKLHWDVVERMIELLEDPEYYDYVTKIKTHYNTNLTKSHWKGKDIPSMLEPFQPSIQASLDGCFETLEYTRDGCRWDVIENNWKTYHEKLNKEKQLGLATVLSAPVLFDIDRYLEFYGPYDPFLHPHYMYRDPDVSRNPGFLDLKWYPKDIFYDTVNHVKRELTASGLRNSSKWIQVLEAYEKEYKHMQVSDKELSILKGSQLYRELFLMTKRGLAELYDITNPAAAEWLRSIEPDYLNPDLMKIRIIESKK